MDNINENSVATENIAKEKSKLVAGLLGIFLGVWGVHNFYLGNIVKGIIQAAVYVINSVLFGITVCIVVFGSLAYGLGLLAIPLAIIFWLVCVGIWIWALVESILIFAGKINKDAKGNPLA